MHYAHFYIGALLLAVLVSCNGASTANATSSDGGVRDGAGACESAWFQVGVGSPSCKGTPTAIDGLCVERGDSSYRGTYSLCAFGPAGDSYWIDGISRDTFVKAPPGWTFAPAFLARELGISPAADDLWCSGYPSCDAGAD